METRQPLDVRSHWDAVYERSQGRQVSWFEPDPATSLRLLHLAAPSPRSVIDVGAGAAGLVDALLAEGVVDLAVLDASASALAIVHDRLTASLGPNLPDDLAFLGEDVTRWHPRRTWQVWHDRAVFHFLVDPEQRTGYARALAAAVEPGGAAVIGVFATDGPTQCSGLPTVRYRAPELAVALGPAFTLVHDERVVHRTPDGREQPFTWVVLRRR